MIYLCMHVDIHEILACTECCDIAADFATEHAVGTGALLFVCRCRHAEVLQKCLLCIL